MPFRGFLFLTATVTSTLGAQVPPVVDSIDVVTHDVFDSSEVAFNPALGVVNALHFRTRTDVVRRELLFRAGQPFDSARVVETARNLRRMGLFRNVLADTFRVNGRLVTRMQTYDGWTTSLELNGRSVGNEFTWSTGITESNFLGTGDIVHLGYRSDTDRSSLTALGVMRRMFGTPVRGQVSYSKLSDGHRMGGSVGVPWRSFSDRAALDVGADAERRLEYRYRGGVRLTPFEIYQSRAVRVAGIAGLAVRADPRGFLRIGLSGMLRNEAFVRTADTLLPVADSVSGAIAAQVDWRRARFAVVTHLNGFDQEEDVDLSLGFRVGAWLAPAAFGYRRSGVGPFGTLSAGAPVGGGFVRISAEARGLFTSAGLDSGRVRSDFTFAVRAFPRQSTVLYVFAGAQRGPEPGSEWDLGGARGPRAFKAHSFTGTRAVWGTIEHRAFLFDEVLNVMGLGFAAFLDYGGAWYPDEQPRRGGNVGLGIRLGATRATGANLGRFDFAYRFGDVPVGERRGWVFSFGRAFSY